MSSLGAPSLPYLPPASTPSPYPLLYSTPTRDQYALTRRPDASPTIINSSPFCWGEYYDAVSRKQTDMLIVDAIRSP